MYGDLRRAAGAFLAAVLLLASVPAYAAETAEEDISPANTAEEALSPADIEVEETPEEEGPAEQVLEEEAPAEQVPEDSAAPAPQAAQPGSGTWGTLSWTLDASGRLTLSGTGEMPENSPWKDTNDFRLGIREIIVGPGITSISDHAFQGCTYASAVTIPDTVRSIGACAFEGCWNLERVIIPGSVQTIGGAAFSDCRKLTGVTLSDGLTSIGEDAFYKCNALQAVNIPQGVTSIGERAFYECWALKEITIPGSVQAISDYAFYGCNNLAKLVIGEGVTSIGDSSFCRCRSLVDITFPNSLASFGPYAFTECDKPVSAGPIGDTGGTYDVKFGWTKAIPDKAFFCLSGLRSAVIPEGIETIGESAFCGCKNLEELTVPASVTAIGRYAFQGCASLTTAGPTGSGTHYQFGWTDSIPACAFFYCAGLTSVEIPESVTSIGAEAFSDCSGLTGVRIPARVETIGERAFFNCKSLAELSLPEGTASIGASAFSFCTGLTSVRIPESVTFIGSGAFSSCTGLTRINIPENTRLESAGVMTKGIFSGCTGLATAGPSGEYNISFGWKTAIPDKAFAGCSGLTRAVLPEGITSIGESAFRDCGALSGLNLPGSVKTIGKWAFDGCGSLTTAGPASDGGAYALKLGPMEAIPDGAFRECGGLTSVTLPASVTHIGKDAFRECAALGSVTLSENTASVGENAFFACEALTSLTIPGTLRTVGSEAFAWCSGLTSAGPAGDGHPYDITFGWTDAIPAGAFSCCTGLRSVVLPEGITSIGERAFYFCSSLTSLTVPDGVTSIGQSAFACCSGLTSITLPESLTTLGEYVFESCVNLTTAGPAGDGHVYDLTFGWKTVLPEYVFAGCSGLTSVVLPEGITGLDDTMFHWCTNLSSITIPNSVTSFFRDGLRNDPFDYCSKDICIYCYPGSPAEDFAKTYGHRYDLLRDPGSGVSAWLSVNAPSGVTVGGEFLIQAGFSAPDPEKLELALPEELVLSGAWLDKTELTAGAYTREGGTLTVPIPDGLPEAPYHLLHLYCQPSLAGSHSIGGRLVLSGGTAQALGTAAVQVSDTWFSVPEKTGFRDGILATGKTGANRTVTLYVDGREAGSTQSNSAGSWKIRFSLDAGVESGATHEIYAKIHLAEGKEVQTPTASLLYQALPARPSRLTMYNIGDGGAQETVFDFEDPDKANLVRYYRIWTSRYPDFTFQASFEGEAAELDKVSIVTVSNSGRMTEIPAAYDKSSGTWTAAHAYTSYENAPVWVYVIYSQEGHRTNRLSAVPIIDPSGSVYEAVPSNRLSGVQAEIWYRDGSGQETLWDAGSFDQLNPQTTGPDGGFYWDVPAGSWQVRFTKAGYRDTSTDWLPVPPPQVGISVPIVSDAAPAVRCAAVYENSAEITFSQYMDIASVQGAVLLNGAAPLAVKALDPEPGADGSTQYATRFRCVVAEALSGKTVLSVSAGALNYAGTALPAYTETFAQPEARPASLIAPGSVALETPRQDITVTLSPSVSGRVLTVENLTPAIIRTGEASVTTGANGSAAIPVEALLPGAGLLRVSEPVSGLEREITVQVKATVPPETSIQASLANGVLTYEVQRAPQGMDAKLYAAGYDGQRMSYVAVLPDMNGTRTLPEAPGRSYVLFLVESGTGRPLCPKCAV